MAAIAEDLSTGGPVERRTPRVVMSVATVAVVASALLIYVSQAFLIAEILGIKRLMQVLLIVPIAVAACYYFVSRPGRFFDPLIGFAMVKLATEIALRGQLSYILDSLASVFALMVLACAPAESFKVGVKFLVTFVGIMALMSLIQWAMIIEDPALVKFVIEVSDDGAIINTVEHPIAVLALHGDQDYTLFGRPVVRMQSFAKEPSLNVIYFLLPACLAFFLKSRPMRLWGGVMLAYCVLSLSGSVFLSLAFSGVMWLMLFVFPVRFALPYGMLGLMGAFLFAVKYFGLEPLMNGFEYLSQYGDFFHKGASLTDRTGGAILNMGAALGSPLGSATISDIPGPWMINSALAAGWFGVFLLIAFLVSLGTQLDAFQTNSPPRSVGRLGVLLLLGALAMVVVFNDYQMGNYSGLILLAFFHRTIQLRNRGDGTEQRRLAT
jgi:hypothetical protein